MKTTTPRQGDVLICAAVLLLDAATTIVRELLVPAVALTLTLLIYARPPAGRSVSVVAPAEPIQPPVCLAQQAETTPAVHPLAELLQPLTCSELRARLGTRSRKLPKLHLQAALIA